MSKRVYENQFVKVVEELNDIKEKIVAEEKKEAHKGGRPRLHKEKMVKTTLVISEELLEETEFTTRKYAGGRSEYISSLIRKDLEENKEKYEILKKILFE